MIVLRAFKTELDLNKKQRNTCVRHAGAARFAYNWGLERKIAAHQAGEKTPSAIDLHRQLNCLKKTELSWMYEVSKCAPQEALRDLDRAFQHFFRRVKEKKAGKSIQVGFPRFKSRKKGLGSFRLTGAIRIYEGHIQLPIWPARARPQAAISMGLGGQRMKVSTGSPKGDRRVSA